MSTFLLLQQPVTGIMFWMNLTSAQSYRGARFCLGLGAAENTVTPGTRASGDESSGRPRVATASLPNASLLMWGCH